MKNNQSGLTLAEIVIIIAIISILIGVVTLPLIKFRQRQALQNSTNAVVAVLNDARTKTLAGLDNTTYSVQIQSDKIILFTGTTYSSGSATNESYTIEEPVYLNWSLNGAVSKVSFNRLTGATSEYGTITLILPDGTTRIITISSSGSITRN